MNCVSPTPKEAKACPIYLAIIQQTFIAHMLYAGIMSSGLVWEIQNNTNSDFWKLGFKFCS